MTMTREQLAAALRRDGPRISARVIEDMWQDPFWEQRFGERGRKRASEDGAFHIEYLLQAIDAEDAGVMARYATWLQSVLTTRGMSTRHLDDNFARLARVIAQDLPGSDAAITYLEAARVALRHPEGPARELQDAAKRATRSEVAFVIEHLADAVALGRPELFDAHAKWLHQIGADDRVRDALAAIDADGTLSKEAKQAARNATA